MQDINEFPEIWEGAANKEVSEDCLQLNVYVPNAISTDVKKPVMVWIHGGGFTMGNGWGYDTSLFALKDVIMVSINYRLGIFGFFSTEDPALPSNFGLWDMIEALKWVNRNIASFGGDPETVTIFGESAGGFAVSYLAVMPSTAGLYKRIIPQNGSPVGMMGIAKNPARAAKATGKFVGCITDEIEEIGNKNLVDCLKKKTSEELLNAQSDPGTPQFESYFLAPVIWPSIDSELLPRSPLDSLNDRKSEESVYFRSLDMLAGTTDNEGSVVSVTLYELQETMEFNLTKGMPTSVLCDAVAPALAKEMFNDERIASDLLCKKYPADDLEQQARNIAVLYGDAWFVAPTVQLIDFHAEDKASPNTYQYIYMQELKFNFVIPTHSWMEGAGHAAELPHMFGPTGLNDMDASLSTDAGRAFTDVLVTYWTNFAKTGNPNGEGLVPWKAFTSKDRDYLQLKYQPVPRQNLYEKRMKFLLQDIPNKIKTNVKTEL